MAPPDRVPVLPNGRKLKLFLVGVIGTPQEPGRRTNGQGSSDITRTFGLEEQICPRSRGDER